MPTAWNVHTSIPADSYIIAQERAPIYEEDTGIASLTLPICFRGTRSKLLDKFPFGKPVTSMQGGAGMFCAGFTSPPSQVPYSEEDPHWDAELKLVGIHTDVPGSSGPYLSAEHAFILTADWTTRETTFPLTVQPVAGDTIYVNPGPPIVPNGTSGNGLWKGRRIDHLPTRNLTGIIISDTEPTPLHPRITSAVQVFPDPPAGLVYDYTSLLLDPVWVTFPGQSAPNTPGFSGVSGGAWLCRNFKVIRRIAPPGATHTTKSIYYIQGTWSWEQLRQPS